jgi:hypothetical protein
MAPTPFVTITEPIGVAATQDGVLITAWEGSPSIFKVTDTKAISVFAPGFVTVPSRVEKYLDVNPGLGPWANKAGFVYVTQGSDVWEITPNGCAVKKFLTIDSGVISGTGITFDRVGTFKYDMILTDIMGNVFRVTSRALITPLVNLKITIENPAVVPVGLGTWWRSMGGGGESRTGVVRPCRGIAYENR